MKFITEEDLRDLYRHQPFTSYELEAGARLTPGARQFLADRGINMFDDDLFPVKKPTNESTKAVKSEPKCGLKAKKCQCKMRSVDAQFLLTAEELLGKDVVLAQEVVRLEKQFSTIREALKGSGTISVPDCQECTGIKPDTCSQDLDDCFPIGDFHIQLEKGREILLLHSLRCTLRELEPELTECCAGECENIALCTEAMGGLNKIINALNQMICAAFGGKTCLRNS